MSQRPMALSGLALYTALVYGAATLVPHASFETVSVWLVVGMAIPATLFAATYMLTSPWWSTAIGQAMLISSTALASLLDVSLWAYWTGHNVSEAVTLTVYAWIFLGAWWKLGALLVTKWRDRQTRRTSWPV